MSHDVFISYASSDRAAAEQVCAALETRGIRCWIAPRNVLPGEDWGMAILAAISAARCMVVVHSAATGNSIHVRNEVVTATSQRLPLVPVHVLRTALTYAHPAGFSITPSVDIVPQGAFVDYSNTFRVPGYALFNVSASAKLPNGGEAFVDVRNIADKRYIADFGPVVLYNPATTASFYPGTGRSIYGGVRIKF